MSDYPDPDEEYELMYADELELILEEEDIERKWYKTIKYHVFAEIYSHIKHNLFKYFRCKYCENKAIAGEKKSRLL